MLVQLSGPTGSGKSVAADILSEFGFKVVREESRNSSPIRTSEIGSSTLFSIQKSIMQYRLSQFKRIERSTRIVFDRGVDEDFYIFCQLFHKIGLLDSEHLVELSKLHASVKSRLPKPDKIIFFGATPSILKERLRARGEGGLIVNTLHLQIDLYESWRRSISGNVTDVDTSNLKSGCYWPAIREAMYA
ncbi:hypothetical protein D3P06_12940 [Paracoccus aestuarii]|uniref:Deoxynucleoside kinase domain-containing protein n=1 Tax=Paracoccus aestuarii TaxID=453842 RepID=A0A418ZT24_9RHOB|nr:deoxynucleoside kinase [Paracoccus aestuarii]RJL00948.1 hypothetical protein D3P06_12940 [Paracoccus aestuarii]WCQ98788.1 deoxynucleoside kinase [Paracoccus aestuarii]